MNTKKKAFIDVFRRNTGNIKATCEKVGMGRTTYYNWIDDDKDFETKVQNVNEELIDYAESQLHAKISQGNLTAIIFYLKTKGQSRGYIEKQYINQKQMTTPIKIFEFSRDEIVIK
jgi:hypothetical protein